MPQPLRRARPPSQRQQRAAEWERWFAGDRSGAAYRRELARLTGLAPDLAWQLVADVVPLLVDRVPATLGVPALLAVSALTAGTAKAEEASRALLATITEELAPAHARTLLETLAVGWHTSCGTLSAEERRRAIGSELRQAVRRLEASGIPGIDAVAAVLEVLE